LLTGNPRSFYPEQHLKILSMSGFIESQLTILMRLFNFYIVLSPDISK